MKLNIVTLAVVVCVLVLAAYAMRGMPMTAPRIVGLVIAVPSFVLLAIARLQLGRAFSIQAKATTLVTGGLYSRIRSPIDVFGALTIAGICIFFQKFWLLLVFVVLIPMQVSRGRKEARALEEKFGEEYREYRKQTWF